MEAHSLTYRQGCAPSRKKIRNRQHKNEDAPHTPVSSTITSATQKNKQSRGAPCRNSGRHAGERHANQHPCAPPAPQLCGGRALEQRRHMRCEGGLRWVTDTHMSRMCQPRLVLADHTTHPHPLTLPEENRMSVTVANAARPPCSFVDACFAFVHLRLSSTMPAASLWHLRAR